MELIASIHEIYAVADNDDYCLHVIDHGHGGPRFTVQRRDDGDYMAADPSAEQVREFGLRAHGVDRAPYNERQVTG